jgi:hypothetical protein
VASQRKAATRLLRRSFLSLGLIPTYTSIDLIPSGSSSAQNQNVDLPRGPRKTFLPDISIIGLAKAGTSQLYHILTHRRLLPFLFENKGHCIRLPARLWIPRSWADEPRNKMVDHPTQRVSTTGIESIRKIGRTTKY